jgi:uncharacterized protein with HEPN domain
MHEAAAKITKYTSGLDAQAFAANDMIRDAVLRNLEVIGEAAKHIPPEVRAEVADLEWRKIIGFRDIVAHAYFGIDQVILWDIVARKIPELIAAMHAVDLDG